MVKEEFSFAGQTFIYEKEEKAWQVSLRRSDVATQDMKALLLLDLHHPLFLAQEMVADEDSVTFTYQVEDYGLSYEDLKARTVSERLRLSLNVLALESALQLPVTFFLHPSNLFISKDSQPKIAYRAIPQLMVPKSLTAEDFLRQVKCFVVTLFTNHDFMELYNGSLEIVDVPSFLDQVRKAETIAATRETLATHYEERLAQETASLTQVPRRRHKVYKLATIWLSASVALLLLPLIYLIFIHNPFKEKMLQADTAFIKLDYSGVIDELERVDVKSLPYTQKYELAYAYIQGLDFSDEQKKVILNNVSLKSDALYLNYWIQVGRGKFEDALDTAKRLNDSDIILYALSQYMKEVREDNSLSGKDRESKLSQLEGDYKKYLEDRNSLLTEESSSSESSQHQTSASDTTASSSAGKE